MPQPFRRLIGMLALLLAVGVSTAAQRSHAAPTPAGAAIMIRNFAFVPQLLTIKPGTTVIWTNVDEDPHTATAVAKAFRSPALDTGGKFSFTFTKAGDYAYFCSLHPHMTGKVIVRS